MVIRTVVLIATLVGAAGCKRRFDPTAPGTLLSQWSGTWTGYPAPDGPPAMRRVVVRFITHSSPIDVAFDLGSIDGSDPEVRSVRATLVSNPDGWRIEGSPPPMNNGVPRARMPGWVSFGFFVVFAHEADRFSFNRGPGVNIGPVLVMHDGTLNGDADAPIDACTPGMDRLAPNDGVYARMCVLSGSSRPTASTDAALTIPIHTTD